MLEKDRSRYPLGAQGQPEWLVDKTIYHWRHADYYSDRDFPNVSYVRWRPVYNSPPWTVRIICRGVTNPERVLYTLDIQTIRMTALQLLIDRGNGIAMMVLEAMNYEEAHV